LLTNCASQWRLGGVAVPSRATARFFQRAFGYASLSIGCRSPATKFRIGSITKQFTAAAILRLQERGSLRVSDTLSSFITDYPRGDKVTLQHLLTHTSGIHDFAAKPDFLATITLPSTPENKIKSFMNDPFDFDPGENGPIPTVVSF
jgi:CubicO group peptidase (beta-lactamase class C family)